MEKFAKNAAIVITFLKENHYSEQTVHNYEKIYNSAQAYLNQKGVIYSPETGEQMLDQQEDSFFGIKGAFIRASSIRKINAVYLYGELKELQISPHRKCHRVILSQEFERAISDFMKSCRETFSTTQQGNISRRIKLFFQYLQLTGISVLEKISYEIIVSYHCHLLTLNLKPISRTLEESSVYQMLDFLAKKDRIPYGVSLCMLLISKGDLVTMDVFSSVERRKLECIRHMDQMLSSEAFLAAGKALLQEHMEAGYVPASCRTFERTVIHFYVFLDMNGLGYLPEIADIWLNCNVVKHAFQGSSWKAAKRFLNIFRDSVMNGQPDFYKVYRKGITGLQDLPDWCRVPLMKFTELRIRQKLESETVKNDIYSILRFIRFLLREGIQSYMELTGELLVQFNLSDAHGSPEGKNACNARIRRFLRYLGREGLLRSTCLFMSLAATTATVETVVVTFTEDEIHSIRDYVASASTPVEIRDSAIIMIGCDMGIRGCDIANLRVGDINWKDQCIHFRQDKTDADVVVAMPVAVGNAVFRYLKEVRNKNTGSDRVFLGLHAPYRPITRNVCYNTLRRVLPDRIVRGSGFHTTRKTFSTNRLRNGVEPSRIAEALGHAGTETLTPYLSLDDSKMSLCPLSLSELSILTKGGF